MSPSRNGWGETRQKREPLLGTQFYIFYTSTPKKRERENKNYRFSEHLRNSDGEVGSKQFGALPEAIQRCDDGARENIFKNLKEERNDYLT